jgi:arylsulfatase A-like enzyme
MRPATRDRSPLDLLWFAARIGLAYGFVEGGLAYGLSLIPGALTWQNATSADVLVVAPLFYGVAFAAMSLPLVALAAVLPTVRWLVVLGTGIGFLAGFLLAASEHQLFGPTTRVVVGLGVAVAAGRWLATRAPERLLDGGLRRLAWSALALALLAGLVFGGRWARERLLLARLPTPAPTRPNVLLLVMDTQRADHLSSYGYARPTTPRLDALATRGTRFEHAWSSAPSTLPSHASLMTGRAPEEHGAGMGGRTYLDGRFPTIADALRRNGYATGGFVANVFWTGRHTGLGRGFVHYEDFFGPLGDVVNRVALGRLLAWRVLPRLGMIHQVPGRKAAAEVNREFLDWVDDVSDRPFFAFLNYFDVHAPYVPPPAYRGLLGPVPRRRLRRIEIGGWDEHRSPPDSSVVASWADRYDESLRYLDAQIGALLDSLDARGSLSRTLVVVTSDHGESFGEHGTIHHGGSVHQEQIRVPLIVVEPGGAPLGRVDQSPIGLTQVPAMIGCLLGIRMPGFLAPRPGRGSPCRPDDPAWSIGVREPGAPPTWQTSGGWAASVVKDRWHLITLQDGRHELYDLEADPREVMNLAPRPEFSGVVATLDHILEDARYARFDLSPSARSEAGFLDPHDAPARRARSP